MDYASTASGEHESKPLLLLTPTPDQDHPDTMNQIIWSLMDLLNAQGITGVPFDKENASSYNRVRLAISQMIAAAASTKATLAEVRAGTEDSKFVTSLGAAAAAGNYSGYVSLTTTPVVFSSDNAKDYMGALLITSGSAAAVTLPALANVPRVGASYTFLNFSATNVTISRAGADTIIGALSGTAVVLRPGQQITLVKIAPTVWAAIGDLVNNYPLQKQFVSAWQNYVSRPGAGFVSASYSIAHGLAVLPTIMIMQLQCLVADGGYSVGNTVSIYANQPAVRVDASSGTPNNTGFASREDATTIDIEFDNNHGAILHEWAGNSNFRLVNNSWKWRLIAIA